MRKGPSGTHSEARAAWQLGCRLEGKDPRGAELKRWQEGGDY